MAHRTAGVHLSTGVGPLYVPVQRGKPAHLPPACSPPTCLHGKNLAQNLAHGKCSIQTGLYSFGNCGERGLVFGKESEGPKFKFRRRCLLAQLL